MSNYWEGREEINELFDAPQHRKLKVASLIVIGVVIVAQFAMLIWRDEISGRTKLLIQGFSGADAILFAVLMAIWAYRVYSEYLRRKSGDGQRG